MKESPIVGRNLPIPANRRQSMPKDRRDTGTRIDEPILRDPGAFIFIELGFSIIARC